MSLPAAVIGSAVYHWLKSKYFTLVEQTARSDRGQEVLAPALERYGLPKRIPVCSDVLTSQPYDDVPGSAPIDAAAERDDVIIISARFRTGSTLLWNLFRHVPGCWAYYEPLNERRWFRPQTKGTDATHRGVDDYWKEYAGLDFLDAGFDEEFCQRRLLLGADDWHPRLQAYISQLIEHARGRPVLQFNRIDFRLPWIRQRYPKATVIHLYRHPRDQWLSVLQQPHAFPPDGRMADFAAADKFYLLTWVADLKYCFPFLEPASVAHPYQLHYYLWRLSYLYGRSYSDYSLSFESLVGEPDRILPELLTLCRIDQSILPSLRGLIEAPALGKWTAYAPDAWFRQHEETCERVLAEFFRTAGTTRDSG